MALRDPAAAAADWVKGLQGAGQKITDGINAVTVAPGQKAAAQVNLYVANVQAAAPKWAKRTAAVGLGEWQAAAIGKGVPRIASGAQAAQSKMADFLTQLFPHIQAGQAKLGPRGNLEQNIQRSADMIRHMATFQRR